MEQVEGRWWFVDPDGHLFYSTSSTGMGAGGVGGYILGSIIAFVLGPQLAGIRVWPMWELAIAAIVISVGLTLVASYFPARSAARLDPCATFQEV